MVIRFLCPNGHKIHCEDDRAGKPAKCPKCGVKFLVPNLAATKEDLIEFLCPSGHRLNGPRSLQGQPGQCPECGIMFRVPSSDEVSDQPVDSEVEIDLGSADAADVPADASDDTVVTLRNEREGEPPGGGEMPRPAEIAPSGGQDDLGRPQPVATPHPLSFLFSRLWAERARGAVIELHLSDGQTMVPDRYAQAMSQGSVGVFALTESDGSHTLIAVAWESVARVVMHGIRHLPDEFRE